jgi:osmotically inducible protein OsmC
MGRDTMAMFSKRSKLRWYGDVLSGNGQVVAGSGAFAVPTTFPRVSGEPPGKTTPEELLAASHATCYGIGLRSLIGKHGGRARRVTVEATITAQKGAGGIRIQSSHLRAVVEGLDGFAQAKLESIAREVAQDCTISIAMRGTIRITHEVSAEPSDANS